MCSSDLRIEGANQRLDHRFVDARFFPRERHDSGATLFGAPKFMIHSRVPNRSLNAYMIASGLSRQFDYDGSKTLVARWGSYSISTAGPALITTLASTRNPAFS